MGETNELPIPPEAKLDPESAEFLRVWVAGGQQHVTLPTGVWEDPFAWGMFLVDLAKHVANTYHYTEGREVDEVLERIKLGFDAEWENATDEPDGGLLK